MMFIELTYFKSARQYGASAGDSGKKFYQRYDLIARITPYHDSSKIRFEDGSEFEVSESITEILGRIKRCESKKEISQRGN